MIGGIMFNFSSCESEMSTATLLYSFIYPGRRQVGFVFISGRARINTRIHETIIYGVKRM